MEGRDMGKVKRKRHSADFKARVAPEAISGGHTLAEISAVTACIAFGFVVIGGILGTVALIEGLRVRPLGFGTTGGPSELS
jgi:hypothetical protein